jgi:hypothetical protein
MRYRFLAAVGLLAATLSAPPETGASKAQSLFDFLDGKRPAVLSQAMVEDGGLYRYAIYYLNADYSETVQGAEAELLGRSGQRVLQQPEEQLWHCPDFCVSFNTGRWTIESDGDNGVSYCGHTEPGMVTVIVSPFEPGNSRWNEFFGRHQP